MNLLITVLLCVITVFLWGMYFFKKNPRRISVKEVVSIFLVGTFSVIPIFLFHNYMEYGLIPLLRDVLALEQGALAVSVLMLFFTGLYIVLFMFLFAFAKATVLHFLYGLPWVYNFMTIKRSFYSIVPLIFVLLLFFLIDLTGRQFGGGSFVGSGVGLLILFVLMEEYCKYMINPFLSDRSPDTISSTVINAIYVGLAFAFIENIVFLSKVVEIRDYAIIFLYRSMITVPMHICAAGILGYFYGLSYFSDALITSYEIEKGNYGKFSWFNKVLKVKKRDIFSSISITQGFFAALLIHGGYNLLIQFGDRFFSTMLVVLSTVFIVYILDLESSKISYGLVGTAEMPDKDFHDLKLKISVMKHIKDIKEGTNGTKTES